MVLSLMYNYCGLASCAATTCTTGIGIMHANREKDKEMKRQQLREVNDRLAQQQERAERLARKYKYKRHKLEFKQTELSEWRGKLAKHQEEYDELCRLYM